MSVVPKVTVCLPTYNRAGLLAACLAGIFRQTFRDFEVIVSDNCSTDDTRSTVLACQDSRVRYYRNEVNIGVFPNMNRCLERARGEYVCILHDDDAYAPWFLERQAAMLQGNPNVGMVHCAAYEIDADNMRRRLIRAYPEDCVREGKSEFLRFLGGHNVCCSTVMVRRELYLGTGGFDASYLCADFFMWLRLALQADVAYVAEPLVAMRVHDAALSSSIAPARWCQEYLAIMERGVALAEQVCPDLLRNRAQLLRRAIRAQGERFFIASVAAVTAGEDARADGYVEVLRQLEAKGLPQFYAMAARMLQNRPGRRILTLLRHIRRLRAVRGLPLEAPWWGEGGASYSQARF